MEEQAKPPEMPKTRAEPAPPFPLHAPVGAEIPPDAANSPGICGGGKSPLESFSHSWRGARRYARLAGASQRRERRRARSMGGYLVAQRAA